MPEDVKLDKSTIKNMEKLEKTKKVDFLGKNFSGKEQAIQFLKTAEAVEKLRLQTSKLQKENKKTEDEFTKQTKKLKVLQKLYKNGQIEEKKKKELDSKINAEMKKLRTNYQKNTEELKKQNVEFDKASAKYKDQKTAIEQMIELEGRYINLLNSKSVVLRKVGAWMSKGKEEVEEYTEAIEKSGGKSIVFGAAAYYMAEKISELGEKVEETAKAFAVFDIRMASLAGATLIAPGGVEELKELRSELYLTTADFQEFVDISIEGVNNGVGSMENMVGALEKLHETFGRNQFDKLKEMVELLQSIPSLNMDLNITASLDDQAASWFALAKKGKVTEAIELQNAGLLGGEENKPEGVDKQVEMLKGLHHAEKLLEDIKKVGSDIYTFFGPIGPEIGMISSTLLAVGAGLGGLVTFFGGMKAIFSKMAEKKEEEAIKFAIENKADATIGQNKNNTRFLANRFAVDTNKIVRAIITKTDTSSGDTILGESKGKGKGTRVTAKPGGNAKALGKLPLGKAGKVGKVASLFSGAGGLLKKGAGLLKGGSPWAMAASLLAQPLAEYGEEHFKKTGNAAGVKASKGLGIGASVAGAAGTGALIGSVIPGVGTAIGGGIGAIVGTIANYSEIVDLLTKSEKLNNSEINKATEAQIKNRLAIIGAMEAQHRSALAMQKYLKVIENNANTEKVSLSNETLNTIDKQLEVFENVGGSVEDFDSVIHSASKNIEDRFKILSEGFEEQRKKILADTDLNSRDRKASLMMLHQKELEAVKQFADGMLGLVGEFDKIPEVIVNKLENKVSKMKIDFGIQTAGMSRKDIFTEVDKTIKNQVDNLNIIFSEYGKDVEKIKNSAEEQMKHNEEIKESIKESIHRVNDVDLQDQLEEVFATDKNGEMNVDTEKLSKYKKQYEEQQKATDEKIDGLMKLPNVLSNYDKANSEFEKMKEEHETKKTEYEGKINETEDPEKKMKYQNMISALVKEEGDSEREVAKLKWEAVKEYKKIEKIDDSFGMTQEQMIDNARRISSQKLIEAEEEKRKTKPIGQMLEVLKTNEKKVNAGVQVQKQLNKSTEALFDNVKEFIDSIEELSNYVGKSFESQEAEANVELLAAQNNMFLKSGMLVGLQNKILGANTNYYQEQMADMRESVKRLEEIKKITESETTFIAHSRESFGKLREEMMKDLSAQGSLSEESLSKMMGGSEESAKTLNEKMKEQVKLSEEINNLTTEQINPNTKKERKEEIDKDVYDKEIKKNDITNELNKLIDGNVQLSKENKDSIKSKIKLVGQESNATKMLKVAKDKAILEEYQLSKKEAEITNSLLDMIDVFVDMPNKIGESFNMKTFNATKEAATAMAEFAAESWNLGQTMKEDSVIVENARKAYAETQKQLKDLSDPKVLEESYQQTIKNLEQAVEEATPDQKPQRQKMLDDFKTNGKEAYYSSIKLKAAENEKTLKDAVVSAAERERKAAEERVDMNIGLMNDTISFMEEMGGSVGDIMEMRKQEIAMEAQKVDIIQKQVDDLESARQQALASGNETQAASLMKSIDEKRVELTKQQMELQKKALGAQRDAYEKMLGLAFGEIRQARGARKGMMSDASLFGRGYVKQAGTDIVLPGSAGQSQTLDERSQQYQAAIGGGMSMQDLKNKVSNITGSQVGTNSPSRIDFKTTKEGENVDMSTFKDTLKPVEKSSDNSNTINNESGTVNEKSPILDLPSNSHTDITSTVELNQKQLTVQEEIRDILNNNLTLSNNSSINQKVLQEDENKKMIGMQSENGTNVAYTSVNGYEQFDRKPTQMQQKNPMENTAATTAQVTVTGEVTVKFDNKMFEQTVVNIVTTNSTITNSLSTRFDNRYVQA